jgi:myosin heavy subunit
MPDEKLKKYSLMKGGKRSVPEDWNYLKGSGTLPPDVDITGYREVQETYDRLKFSEEEQDGIWRICALVLHLGQLEYNKTTYDESKNVPCSIKNQDELKIVADLYGIADIASLEKPLTMKLVKAPTKNDKDLWTIVPFDVCKANRDSLCKQIFNCMFNWLVKRMNISIEPANMKDESFKAHTKTIGLLDIFGFENFPAPPN